jgi:hypothetical protein
MVLSFSNPMDVLAMEMATDHLRTDLTARDVTPGRWNAAP